MNKRLICIMIIFIIFQAICMTTNYIGANEGKIKLAVSSATGKAGDEVSININLSENSNFVSANLTLNYNTEYLEYVSHTKGDVLESSGMSIVKNNSDTGKIAIGYVGDPGDEKTTVQAGNVLKVVFKLKSNLNKETDLILEVSSIKDKDGNDLTGDLDIANGQISLEVKDDDIKDDSNKDDNNKDDDNKDDNNKDDDNKDDSNKDDNNKDDNNKDDNNKDDNNKDDNNKDDNNKDDNNKDDNNKDDNNKDDNNKDDNNKDDSNKNDNTNNGKPNNGNQNNTEIKSDIPYAGVSGQHIFIIIDIAFAIISIILYKKNKSMKGIM